MNRLKKIVPLLLSLSLVSCSDKPNRYNEGFNEGKKLGYTEGYDEGYDDGHADGDAAGYERARVYFETAGYNEGFSEGHSAGVAIGYMDGYSVGKNETYDGAYSQGYKLGENDGYDQGKASGEKKGYNDGYDDGYADKYDPVFQNGYSAGHNDGKRDGENQGYSDGKYDGYKLGYDDGHDDGYDAGYDDGVDVSYSSGYNDGYDDGYIAYNDSDSGDDYDYDYDDDYYDDWDDSWELSVGKTKRLKGYSNLISMAHNDTFDYSRIAPPRMTRRGLVAKGRLLFSETSLTNKDTLKRAAVTEQYLVIEMASQVKAKFGLSAERSLKVAKAANHFRKYSSKRALTEEDTNAYASEIIGVNFKEIEKAYERSMKGELKAVSEVLEKAAEKNGTTPENIGIIISKYFL